MMKTILLNGHLLLLRCSPHSHYSILGGTRLLEVRRTTLQTNTEVFKITNIYVPLHQQPINVCFALQS